MHILFLTQNEDLYLLNSFATICMGVGGTLDVVSGNVKLAPKIFQITGTEWLSRLIREPKRIKRQLVLPKFTYLVLKQKLFADAQ